MNLADLSIRGMSNMLKSGEICAMELLDAILNVALKGSCITFCSEQSFESAKDTDNKRLHNNNIPPLSGIPFSLKDNFSTENILTSCNSRSMKTNKPQYNSFVAQSLLDAGAVLTAKNCMREFSVGKIEDSAFELRNYISWAGTDKNTNIGAFSIGTDLGIAETFFGLWVLKPGNQEQLVKGLITGAPSLERATILAKHADDLRFLLPFVNGEGFNSANAPQKNKLEADRHKILVYDNLNYAGFLMKYFEQAGFNVHSSDCRFLDYSVLLHEVILSTEFFRSLIKIGMPTHGDFNDKYFNSDYYRNRIEGLGFEVKRLIVMGAHLLSEKRLEKTKAFLKTREVFTAKMHEHLEDYDFIAAPLVYDDKLSKASAVAGLCELTVPLSDIVAVKLVTKSDKQDLLLDAADLLAN